MEQLPQIVAVLRAIEERLTAIDDLLATLIRIATDPEGRVQTAQTDTLKIYGVTGFSAETLKIQRDQLRAVVDALGVLVGRFIEHDRKVTKQHAEFLALLQSLAQRLGQDGIAADAALARDRIAADEDARESMIALAEEQARKLLSTARTDATAQIATALNQAEHALSAQADAARIVVEDAAETARETLKEESSEDTP